MKKILFILIACFGLYAVNYATDSEVVKTEKTNLIVNGDLSIDNIVCDNPCPDDDCFNGCLYSTYKTEYCVGSRCRDRTLYKCNICRSTWWIYH
jgi:hypothetical protein